RAPQGPPVPARPASVPPRTPDDHRPLGRPAFHRRVGRPAPRLPPQPGRPAQTHRTPHSRPRPPPRLAHKAPRTGQPVLDPRAGSGRSVLLAALFAVDDAVHVAAGVLPAHVVDGIGGPGGAGP